MIWQDAVFTVGALVFFIALFPTILSSTKPALATSATTGTVLLMFAATYVTLGLYFSATTTAITGLAWLLISWQTLR